MGAQTQGTAGWPQYLAGVVRRRRPEAGVVHGIQKMVFEELQGEGQSKEFSVQEHSAADARQTTRQAQLCRPLTTPSSAHVICKASTVDEPLDGGVLALCNLGKRSICTGWGRGALVQRVPAAHACCSAFLDSIGPDAALVDSPSVAKKVRVMAALVNSSVTSMLDACDTTGAGQPGLGKLEAAGSHVQGEPPLMLRP